MKSKLVGKSHICLQNKDCTKTDSVKNLHSQHSHSQHSHSQHSLREGMCKSHYGNQDFSPLVNVVYFILIIIKIPLRNGNYGSHYRNGSRTCLLAHSRIYNSLLFYVVPVSIAGGRPLGSLEFAPGILDGSGPAKVTAEFAASSMVIFAERGGIEAIGFCCCCSLEDGG